MHCIDRPGLTLIDIVDLKWLLAREGRHIHVERLQREPAYAQQCLGWAAISTSLPVREAGARVARGLAHLEPAAPRLPLPAAGHQGS